MAIRVATAKTSFDTLVCFQFDGDKKPSGALAGQAKQVEKAVNRAGKASKFKGEARSSLIAYPERQSWNVVVMGLGKAGKADLDTIRRAAGRGLKAATAAGGKKLTFAIPTHADHDVFALAEAVAEGAGLASYAYDIYKKKKSDKFTVAIDAPKAEAKEIRAAVKLANATVEGVCFARDLVNGPAMDITPEELVRQATALEGSSDRISLKVLNPDQIREERMGSFLSVSLGSDQPPYFIELEYSAPGADTTVALVGKGVTFDSGGLDIKGAENMRLMKIDMGGAAAVLGTFRTLVDLEPDVNVCGYVAATENMTGGHAYKPGDVLTTRNGKTIEVDNTDAEGRLTLIDALDYAGEKGPDVMIDLATLTGAAMVAMGPTWAPVFSSEDDLATEIISAAKAGGENLWQLPLVEEYRDLYKSYIADMKNTGGRAGGAITAALILSEFVPASVKWAHIDLAAPTWSHSDHDLGPTGGTGFGVRTLVRYIRSLEQ